MTATDELRRMLDERGVKHYDGVECTYWGDTVLARRDGSCPIYRFSATEVADGVSVHLLRVSPEQAIEATLGRGTCRDVCASISEFTCSACGFRCDLMSWETLFDGDEGRHRHHHYGTPRYCPNCGRKVVDDASVD